MSVAAESVSSPWRDQALYLLGEAHLLVGELDAADEAFRDGSIAATAKGNTDIVVGCEMELAVLTMNGGRWVEAADHVQIAMTAIDEQSMSDYSTSVLAFAEAARLALHRGDLEDVQRQLTRAMRARPDCTYVMPYLAVRGRLRAREGLLGAGRPDDSSSPGARDR